MWWSERLGAGGSEGSERVQQGRGCCISKDGTLVITAAERAFVPLAYLWDEIIPKPKRSLGVPLLALSLKMQGHTMRKRNTHSDRRGHMSPERILEWKAVYWDDTLLLSRLHVPTAQSLICAAQAACSPVQLPRRSRQIQSVLILYGLTLMCHNPALIIQTNRQNHP